MRRKALALAGLLMVLLASFTMFPHSAMAQGVTNAHYWVMGGNLESITQMYIFPVSEAPYFSRGPDITPWFAGHNITFSAPWGNDTFGYVVDLTVPASTFRGIYHVWYDATTGIWFNLNHTLEDDGYGWIFLNETGDVDIHTFNNDTGAYWKSPSPKAGTLAAQTGSVPDLGPDQIAGTGDDGFGDNDPDPPGSSILILPSKLRCEYWAMGSTQWGLLFDISWPVIFTTGTAYDIVNETASELDTLNYTRTGKPWEFYAGLDHTGWKVNWNHPYSNAYVTYACAWSMLNIWTGPTYQYLDVLFAILYKLMRDDCALPDILDDNEYVTIGDVRRAGKAYDTYDEGPYGTPKVPPAPPNKPQADKLYDAAADVKGPVDYPPGGEGYVGIADVRRVAKDYEMQLTPTGIKPA